MKKKNFLIKIYHTLCILMQYDKLKIITMFELFNFKCYIKLLNSSCLIMFFLYLVVQISLSQSVHKQ